VTGRPRRIAQAGAALLAAMLTVTLVATFAAASLWQQWRSVEIETAERARVQSAWVLIGALDWARLILREDARAGGADHLAEPWAVPLQEARLSTVLAADRSATIEPEADNIFLSGQIIDAQSQLNVTNLVEAGSISAPALRSFGRLFDLLGLPANELQRMAENLRFASDISTDNRSAGQAPLTPQRVEQLAWLGLSLKTVAALEPYVTVLPTREAANINTASAEVIYASVNGISMADARRVVAERDNAPVRNLADAARLLGVQESALADGTLDVRTKYFEVLGRLRLGDVAVEERSLVYRSGMDVRPVRRDRGVFDPTAVARAAAAQGRR
jgi:general secretion pathway protein K